MSPSYEESHRPVKPGNESGEFAIEIKKINLYIDFFNLRN